MIERAITITIRLTLEEVKRLDEVWKYTPGFTNRTQYVREAINAYAGEPILLTKKCWRQREQEALGEVSEQ